MSGLKDDYQTGDNGLKLTDNMRKFVEALPSELTVVLEKVRNNGGQVWIVGGAVRDAEMGVFSNDIDLATDLDPEQVIAVFPDCIQTGIKYGTVTVKSGNKLYQMTTLRSDGDYLDMRRPHDVQWEKSLITDLSRRDFTINSMAIDAKEGILFDPFNGLNDIKNKVIKCVGLANRRISEDSLRILRAFRFISHGKGTKWRLDKELERAIELNYKAINSLPGERIWQEFEKICKSQKASFILIYMAELKILNEILGINISQNKKIISSLMKITRLEYLHLIVLLFSDSKNSELKKFCERLRISSRDIRKMEKIQSFIGILPNKQIKNLRLYRHLAGDEWHQQLTLESAIRLHYLDNNDSEQGHAYVTEIINAIAKLPPLHHTTELANGNWLMQNTDITEGRRLGRLKQWLFRLQIENDFRTLSDVRLALTKIDWTQEDFENWPLLEMK